MNFGYVVDANDPDQYWFNMTMYETELYNFNINYNPDLKVTNLWVNVVVRAEGNKAILSEVQTLQNVTGVMQDSVKEMTTGASKIDETGQSLKNIAEKWKIQSKKLVLRLASLRFNFSLIQINIPIRGFRGFLNCGFHERYYISKKKFLPFRIHSGYFPYLPLE